MPRVCVFTLPGLNIIVVFLMDLLGSHRHISGADCRPISHEIRIVSVARAFFWGPSSIYVQVSSTKDRRIQSGLFRWSVSAQFPVPKKKYQLVLQPSLPLGVSVSFKARREEKRRGHARHDEQSENENVCVRVCVLSLTSSVCACSR
jgi:hypothetical protein